MLSNSSLQTFGSWASKGAKTVAATLESAANTGKAVVESTLQELVESEDEDNKSPQTIPANKEASDVPSASEHAKNLSNIILERDSLIEREKAARELIEALNAVIAQGEAERQMLQTEIQRLQLRLVEAEQVTSALKRELASTSTKINNDQNEVNDELVKLYAHIKCLTDQVESAEQQKNEYHNQLKRVESLKRLIGRTPCENESDDYSWIGLLEEKLNQVIARNTALEATNQKMTEEYNQMCHSIQDLQRQLSESERHAEKVLHPSTSHVSQEMDESRLETVMALEARLAAKAQRLDALVIENHSLKMQLQDKKAPFSNALVNEFQKTIVFGLFVKPICRLINKIQGYDVRSKSLFEDSFKRYYGEFLALQPLQKLWYINQRVMGYRDSPLILLLLLVALFFVR